jgi:hypothetical protein
MMGDFVLYHKSERMGYAAEEVEQFCIVTKKNIPGVIGSRVWIIAGTGTPRTFQLVGCFIAAERTQITDAGFSWRVTAPVSAGIRLPDGAWPTLNREPWWKEFQASQSNFSFGLQAIKDRLFIEGLEAVLQSAITPRASRRPRA